MITNKLLWTERLVDIHVAHGLRVFDATPFGDPGNSSKAKLVGASIDDLAMRRSIALDSEFAGGTIVVVQIDR